MSDLPRDRDQLLAIQVEQNAQIVRLMGALGDLVDAVERGVPVDGDLEAVLVRARVVLGRD